MSHFSVLVVTRTGSQEELAAALQPFHEYECTGIEDRYVVEVDKTEEVHKEFANAAEDEDYKGMTEAQFAEAYFGYDEENLTVEDGKVVKATIRTNPNAKWDWWVVGGRWGSSLLTKDGRKVDICQASELNLEGMKAEKALKARRRWKTVRDVLMTAEVDPASFRSWEAVMGNRPVTEAVRQEYANQPAVAAIEKFADAKGTQEQRDLFCIMAPELAELMAKDCATYMDEKQYVWGAFYAMIDQDGTWNGRGEMGWWGVSTGEDDPVGYAKKMFERLEELKKTDAWVTVVDCHI